MKINTQRMLARIGELAEIGKTVDGGSCRIALSEDDRLGRELLVSWMKETGLEVRIDEVGNIFGLLEGERNNHPIMMGSHIDTVANGGHLDGCYGVIAALEVIATFVDHGHLPQHTLCVAIFTNEEGVRFQPDMMGSLVYAGGLSVEEAHNSLSPEGIPMRQELEDAGYLGDMKCGSLIPLAFLELHIEQGPVLEQKSAMIGVVCDVQGISWTRVTFTGQSNHAGTTPMELRKDAGYAAARLIVELREIVHAIGHGQVATTGEVNLEPNLINVVPGTAQVSVDLRNNKEQKLAEAEALLHTAIKRICSEEGVAAKTEQLVRLEPVPFDLRISGLIDKSAKKLGFSCIHMTSGAGHDAQMLARVCPTAMIFVPSADGISHHFREHTAPEFLEAGGQVLFETLSRLDKGYLAGFDNSSKRAV